jgi:transposase/DNA-binding CsgD family transcriptional regulator
MTDIPAESVPPFHDGFVNESRVNLAKKQDNMANKRKTMLQIRKVIQLLANGCSEREVSRLAGIHRKTVRDYHSRIKQSGKEPAELLRMKDAELAALVYPPEPEAVMTARSEVLEAQMEHYLKELKRPGVTRQLLWIEYQRDNPDRYSYSRFCERLSHYESARQPTMHLEHSPGDVYQFDFAGKPLYYLDSQSNLPVACPVLVCNLPYSSFGYVEPLASAKLEHLVPAMNRAVAYLGGVPRNMLTDNMAQIVTRSNRYEPTFTAVAEQWALHNNTNLKATRRAKPKDKPSVEKAVDLTYQHVYAPMRNEVFYSLEALRDRVWELHDQWMNRPMYKYQPSRRQRFEQEEKPLLRPLPDEPYVYKHRASAKVKKNYHVILGEDWHQYSVPYQYIGRQVTLVYDDQAVEIFLELHRIAIHRRNYRRNGYTTLAEHMPESHRRYKEQRGWTHEDFTRRASLIGEHTRQAIELLLKSRTFMEQTYDGCLGVLRLGDKYGKDRLEAACRRASQAPRVTYRTILNILENNQDKIPIMNTPNALVIPEHENIRGPQAYK